MSEGLTPTTGSRGNFRRESSAARAWIEGLEARTLLSATHAPTASPALDGPSVGPADAASLIYDAGSTVAGNSMPQWNAEYWRWLYSFTAAKNPAFDTTGAQASRGNESRAFLLAFVSSPDGKVRTAHRKVKIPKGKPILVPIATLEEDNARNSGNHTAAQLQNIAATDLSTVTDLALSVDGESVSSTELFRHREIPGPFSFTLPSKDNVFQRLGLAVKGRVSPAVADGYVVMLKPLAVGSHTIHFGISTDNATFDVTYDVVVAKK